MNNRLLFKELGNYVGELYDFFGKDSKPKAGRLELWYQKLKNQNGPEVKQAFDHIKDHSDRLPVNIPKAVREGVRATQGEKTHEWKDYGECQGCNSTGMYKLRVQGGHGRYYEPIVFCGDCENWRNRTNDPGRLVSKSELVAKRIRHKPYNKCLSYTDYKSTRAGTVKELQELASNATKDMETV